MKKQDFLIALLLGIVTAVFLFPTINHFSGFLDEGLVLAPAHRVLQGEVAYRDIYLFTTPGTVYAYAVLMMCFGPSTWITGSILFGVRVLSVIGLYGLSRTVLHRKFALVPPLVYLFSYLHETQNFVNHWFPNLLFIYALFLVVQASKSGRLVPCVLSGLLVAQTGMSLQTFGVVLLLAGLVAFWGRWRRLAIWLGAVAGGALPWFLHFAWCGSLANFYADAIVSNLDRADFERVSFGKFWLLATQQVESSWLNAPIFILIVVCPLVSLVWPLVMKAFQTENRLSREFWVLYVSSVLMLFVCCYRLLPSQLLMHHFVSVIVFTWCCQSLPKAKSWLAFLLPVALLPVAFNFWQSYGLAERYVVQFPQGPVWVKSEDTKKSLEELRDFFAAQNGQERPVLLTPYVPNLYYLLDLKPATRFVQLRARQYTREHMLEALEDLKRQDFPKIFHFPAYESRGFLLANWPDESPELYWQEWQWFLDQLAPFYQKRDFGALHLYEPKGTKPEG